MDDRLALRAAGVAAMAGGLLRVAAPLAPRLGPEGAQLGYLVIDIALMLGLVGFYGHWARATGRIGLAAFAVATAGVLAVRSQGAVPGAYMAGAALWSLGMATLGLRLLFVWDGPRVAPLLWLAAVPVGLTGPVGLLAAGTLFGLGSFWAGAGLIRARD